jgi:hypothetical protein
MAALLIAVPDKLPLTAAYPPNGLLTGKDSNSGMSASPAAADTGMRSAVWPSNVLMSARYSALCTGDIES